MIISIKISIFVIIYEYGRIIVAALGADLRGEDSKLAALKIN
jgi:hypothetical protein